MFIGGFCKQGNGLLQNRCPCPANNGNNSCQSGRCDLNGDQTEFICLQPLPNGSECDEDTDCQSRYCDLDNNMCAPPPGIAGSACGTTSNCYLQNYCNNGKCVPKEANGSLCSDPEQCLGGNCILFQCQNKFRSGTLSWVLTIFLLYSRQSVLNVILYLFEIRNGLLGGLPVLLG